MATAQRKSNALALPDDVVDMLAAEDKRKGFPLGTMQSLMSQEIGGQESKYLSDVTAYHYPLNAEGKRIAKQTGKVSTAFGPFGLLESTAKDPGYGVTPLGDKKSFAEQARFSADYLDARSKAAGNLNAGLAGYGQGQPYAQQVIARRDNIKIPDSKSTVAAPVVTAAAPQAAPVFEPVVVAQADAPPPSVTPAFTPVAATAVQTPSQMLSEADAWQEFLAQSRTSGVAAPVTPQAQAYKPLPLNVPDFLSMVSYMNKDRTPTGFQAFTGMGASV